MPEPIDPKGREILPCPFCGGRGILEDTIDARFVVICGDCLAHLPRSPSRSGAVAAWNRRENREAVQHAYAAALQRAAGRVKNKAETIRSTGDNAAHWIARILEEVAKEIEEDTTNATNE